MPRTNRTSSTSIPAQLSEVRRAWRPSRSRRAHRTLALVAGALTFACAGALPSSVSAIIIHAAPDSFSGVGVTRSLETLSITASEDPDTVTGLPAPGLSVALWRSAGAVSPIGLQLSCVNITIGRTQSSVEASGRSATSGGYFTLRATDGGLGGPDTFAVTRHGTQPAGFQDPTARCGARDLVTARSSAAISSPSAIPASKPQSTDGGGGAVRW
jgi:hypothetical protein